jgi:hypothetical protein
MREHQENLCQVEVPIEKRAFQVFQEEERDNCDYALESSLLQIWEYTKAK